MDMNTTRAASAASTDEYVEELPPEVIKAANPESPLNINAAAKRIREKLREESASLLRTRHAVGLLVLQYQLSNSLSFAETINQLAEELGEDDGILRDAHRLASAFTPKQIERLTNLEPKKVPTYSVMVELSKLPSQARAELLEQAVAQSWRFKTAKAEVEKRRTPIAVSTQSQAPSETAVVPKSESEPQSPATSRPKRGKSRRRRRHSNRTVARDEVDDLEQPLVVRVMSRAEGLANLIEATASISDELRALAEQDRVRLATCVEQLSTRLLELKEKLKAQLPSTIQTSETSQPKRGLS